jgi:metal-responsive CopG/Arc/MetJ family transcriptional regulator
MAPIGTTRRIASVKPGAVKEPLKERILLEFPAALMRRAEEAARTVGVSRSEFIRTAVEARLEAIAEVEFERELEESCKANAEFNLQILKEFEHVDRDAWKSVP